MKKLKPLEFLTWSEFEHKDFDADPADMEVIARLLAVDVAYDD